MPGPTHFYVSVYEIRAFALLVAMEAEEAKLNVYLPNIRSLDEIKGKVIYSFEVFL